MTSSTQTQSITDLIAKHLDAIVEIRHDLHAHPEVLFTEERTSRVIQEELTRLGIAFRANIGGKEPNTGTGVVAHIPATVDNPGGCIGLRADIDALPIEEQSSLSYKSTTPGKMHACGHDGHTSILLGTARVLLELEHRPNPVTLVFQPAEEGGGGGEKMIRDGALAGDQHEDQHEDQGAGLGTPVTRMYGLHGWPDAMLGTIGTRKGPLLAATDTFDITLVGTQGHAAYPHQCNDPIVAAAQIISAAQTLVSRNTRPTDSVVVTFADIHSGMAYNIIPERATMRGTIRTLDSDTRLTIKARFFELVESTAKAMGCQAQIDWHDGYPVTFNNHDEADRIAQTADNATLTDCFEWIEEPVMGGEDFAYYGLEVPACFYTLGLNESKTEPYPGLHTPNFDFNDKAIGIGIEMMCLLALS